MDSTNKIQIVAKIVVACDKVPGGHMIVKLQNKINYSSKS